MSAPTAVPPSVQIATLRAEIERLECVVENTQERAATWEKRCRDAWSALYHISAMAHKVRMELTP